VHTEEWGYFKADSSGRHPLTRIDGMMIIGMFGGCFAAALWANNVKLRMPKSRIRIMQAVAAALSPVWRAPGDGLQPGRLLYRYSAVFASRLVLCRRHGHRLFFGARFTLLPFFRIPVKMTKVPPRR
jgi:hypothetical protein